MKTVRVVGLGALIVASFVIAYLVGYGHGAWNQAAFEVSRWDAVRTEMLYPPSQGARPYSRVIPELGIRVRWIEWRNGPVRQVLLEDLR